jgi:hypothetical protein
MSIMESMGSRAGSRWAHTRSVRRWTNKDIAAALFLSQKTIESHIARFYTKLNIHARAALTAATARADRRPRRHTSTAAIGLDVPAPAREGSWSAVRCPQ